MSSVGTAWDAKGPSDQEFEFGVEALDRVVLKLPEFATGKSTERDLLAELDAGLAVHQLNPPGANGPAGSTRTTRNRTFVGPYSCMTGFGHLLSIERPLLPPARHMISQAEGRLARGEASATAVADR